MNSPLFQFQYKRCQRRKKARGALRQAKAILNSAREFGARFSHEDWFNYSHQHLDWNGIGDQGWRIRRLTLEAHAHVFRAYASAAKSLNKPFQVWLSLPISDAGQDAVYCHSPNPYADFPAGFSAVSWGVPELESLLSVWLPDFRLVAGKGKWNYIVYAKGVGLSLETPRDEAFSANHTHL